MPTGKLFCKSGKKVCIKVRAMLQEKAWGCMQKKEHEESIADTDCADRFSAKSGFSGLPAF